MCFVHAHHENTKFKFLTVSLFHYSYKQPFFLEQVSKWAWNKLNMHLKLYIPKVFSDWISSHNLCTWLAENISRYSSFCLHTHTHMQWLVDVNDFYFWTERFLWVCSYEQKQPSRLVPLKCKVVHEFGILAKLLKSKNELFAYFLWIPILRNTSDWLLSRLTDCTPV